MTGDVFVFPMSAAQERLWFLSQLDPDSASYNLPAALLLQGPLDAGVVARCSAEIVQRHEALRTTFEVVDGRPSQLVHDALRAKLIEIDLAGLAEGPRQTELQRAIAREAQRPFDLSHGPLLRTTLVRLAAQEHVLLWVVHHSVFDGWSTSLVLSEFAALYCALRAGKPSPLPTPKLQYADFAEWEQQRVAQGALIQQLDYWRAQLGQEEVPLGLPFDRPRPAQQGFRGARYLFSVPVQLAGRLRVLAQQRGATLYALLLASYKALLFRYSGQTDIRVSTPVTNRNRSELEGIVGCFANTVVLRSNLKGDPTFGALLAHVQDTVRAAEAHRDVPFDQVVEALQPVRDPSRAPLCQVMFALQPDLGERPAIPGVSMRLLDVESGGAQLDLALELAVDGLEMSAALEYDLDLFDAATVARMAQHWLRLLESVVAAPDARLSQLAVLSDDERASLLALSRSADSTLDQRSVARAPLRLFEEHAARDPDKLALLHEGRALSYVELRRAVDHLAGRLIERGVGPEVRVAVCLPRSVEMIVAVLAVMKAGGAYVPVDPRYPAGRIELLLHDAGVHVAIADDAARALLPSRVEVVSPPASMQGGGDGKFLPFAEPHPQQAAYVLFTSGSTGTPKGVVIPHVSFARFIDTAANLFDIRVQDRVLQFAALSFDASVEEIFPCLARGATLVLRSEAMLESVETFLRSCEELAITALELPTMYFHRVVAGLADGLSLPASFRLLLIGGEAALPEFVRKWRDLPATQQVRLLNTYGPAEASVTATECDLMDSAPCAGWAVSIGRPLANTRVYVLDAAGQLLPQGAVGELYLGGDSLARGYHERPALSAQRFVPNPFATTPGERLYRTGDRVRYRPDGQLEFIGRVDHQVKLRGFRIEPGEIEARLVAVRGVREAIVILHEDSPQQRRLVAYVSTDDVTPDTMRAALKGQLPDYMVPSVFMVLPTLPHNTSGKIDRRALPAPSIERDAEADKPRNAVEAALAEIWAEALRLPSVGTQENFFELGGESILALQVVARARAAGLVITARQLFLHQTVAALATVALPVSGAADLHGAATGELPLTPIQHWFFAQQVPNRNHWNQSVLLSLRAPMRRTDLEAALHSVIAHHDAFRLRYRAEGDGWKQWYAAAEPAACLRLLECDLAGMSASERQATVLRVGGESQAGLDIEQGPLLVAVLFRDTSASGLDSDRLLLAAHHLVVDGVSWRIVLEDLQTAYRQQLRGDAVRLLETTTSYAAWAHQLTTSAPDPGQLPHAGQASGWSAVFTADIPQGDDSEASTVRNVQEFEAPLTERLLTAPRTARMRIDELLLAAFALALHDVRGADGFVVELEGHGRDVLPELDVSRTVGWFTRLRQVPLKTVGVTLTDTLKSLKEQLRAETEDSTRGGAPPAVSFNYLGQWDDLLDGDALFALAEDDAGPERDPHAKRGYAMEIDAAIVNARLRITWSYSGARYHAQTLAALQDTFAARLEQIVRLCETTQSTAATPSDFPLASLDQPTLDRLVAERGDVQDVYPLSSLQQGLLFHSLWEAGTGTYVEQVQCNLLGALDVQAFRRAWEQVIASHDALRTTFIADGNAEPLQVVQRASALELTLEDWREHSGPDQAAMREQRLAADRVRGFDLRSGPLLRLSVFRLADDAQTVLLSHHHLILDGWSAAIVLRDAFVAYEALRQGKQNAATASRPYRDYIGWLRTRELGQAESYFRTQLSGFSAATELPFARPKRAVSAAEGAMVSYGVRTLTFSRAFTGRLETSARRQHVTLNTLLSAAWAFVLARSSGSGDVLFGTTSSGRSAPLPGIDSMVGLFINTVPLHVSVPSAMSVGDWLLALLARIGELAPHEHTPLHEVQGWSGVPRGQPLFESLLVFENYPSDAQIRDGLPTLHVSDVSYVDQTNYPLTLSILPSAELTLRLSYEHQRFADDDAERLLKLVEGVLKRLIDDPTRRLGELTLLGDLERAQLVERCSGSPGRWREAPFVHVQFERMAAEFPTHTAIALDQRRISYDELNRRANQLAHALRRRGVGADQLVAISAERSVELVVGLLGIMKAGAAYVPVDPDYPPARVAYMLEDAAATVLVSTWPVASRLPAHGAELICLDADRAQIERESTDNPNVAVGATSLAYTIYTSGSTGQPKAAGNTHAGLLNRLSWMQQQYRLTPSDRVLQKTPFSFDVSVWEFFWPLMTGATLVMARPGDHRDTERLWTLVEQHGVTTLHFVPPMLEAFLACDERKPKSSLRRVICSGEALPGELVRRCFEELDVELHNLYGPTEASIDVTSWPCQRGAVDSNVPIGQPIADTQIYILDRCGQLLPPGMVGELHIGGVGLARGYHRRAALTADRFIPDPFSSTPGARLYRTGDLARMRGDGAIEFLGRLDHQVKIRGLRVELGEIEARLLAHPGMREAVVVAHAEGHGGKRLIAYVSGAGLPAPEQLQSWLATDLPAYMVPTLILILERLPLSPNGKVDRRALPTPEALAASTRPYVAPRTDAERILAQVWSDVLHIERVGIDDDFFALGGDSIVTLQVLARAAQQGLKLTPKLVFEHPTIAALAAHADAIEARGAAVPTPAEQPSAELTSALSEEEWSGLLEELDR